MEVAGSSPACPHYLRREASTDARIGNLSHHRSDSRHRAAALRRNAPEFGIRYIDATDAEQGIVHVVGPEQGFSLPGATIVCGDSHTSSHGGVVSRLSGGGSRR